MSAILGESKSENEREMTVDAKRVSRPSASPPKFKVSWIPLGVAKFGELVIGAKWLMDWIPYCF
jgi:hypothetical protein